MNRAELPSPLNHWFRLPLDHELPRSADAQVVLYSRVAHCPHGWVIGVASRRPHLLQFGKSPLGRKLLTDALRIERDAEERRAFVAEALRRP